MKQTRSDIIYLVGLIESRTGVDVPKNKGTAGSTPPADVSSSGGNGEWTINKTYADLNTLYSQGLKPGVQWHREDGSVIAVPLTGVGEVDGKQAFSFSVILTDDDGSVSHTFILNDADELTYITDDVGGGGGGGGIDTAFQVVPLKDGKPDVARPSKKIIYLTKEAGSSKKDPYTEWIYTEDSSWAIIGETSIDLSGYKTKQGAVPSPTPSGNSIVFIDSISQDKNGKITASAKTIPTATTSSAGLMPAAAVEKLDGISAGAEKNVQADWNEDDPNSDAYIKNKPEIPSGQTQADWNEADSSKPSYIKNKPQNLVQDANYTHTDENFTTDLLNKLDGIEAGAQANVKPDWDAASGSDAEILNKPAPLAIQEGDGISITESPSGDSIIIGTVGKADKVDGAVQGHLAALDANGNLADSGVAPGAFKTKQNPVADPTAAGNAIEFISGISQNENGEILPEKKTIPDASGNDSGLMPSAAFTKLEGIEAGAQVNVKPDWDAATGSDAEILNKPAPLDIAPGPGIAITESSGTLVISTTGGDVSAKADKVANATSGNFAGLNAEGNLTDSGSKASDFGTAAQGAKADTALQGITVDSGSPLTPDANRIVDIDLSGKVDKEAGKALSSNDYTAADKATVATAAAVIPSDASSQNQLVSASKLAAALANFGGFKVSPGTGADNHPDESDPNTKTIYLVKDASAPGDDKYLEWICTNTTGPVWEKIGDTSLDLSGYVEYPSTHTDTHLVAFGPGESIVDAGKAVSELENAVTTVSIGGGSGIAPTAGTKNIDIPLAANSNGTGSSGAMSGTDKVKLDGVEAGAQANVKPDWTAASGSNAEILNKPNLATVATSGDYADLQNAPDVLVPVASGALGAPTSATVVTAMPPSGEIVAGRLYFVKEST